MKLWRGVRNQYEAADGKTAQTGANKTTTASRLDQKRSPEPRARRALALAQRRHSIRGLRWALKESLSVSRPVEKLMDSLSLPYGIRGAHRSARRTTHVVSISDE